MITSMTEGQKKLFKSLQNKIIIRAIYYQGITIINKINHNKLGKNYTLKRAVYVYPIVVVVVV